MQNKKDSNDTSIELSKFATMSEKEQKVRVDALFQSAINPTQEQLKFQWDRINAEIEDFEKRYNMPSTEMLKTGCNLNFPDVGGWIIAVRIREKIKEYSSSKNKVKSLENYQFSEE